MAHYILAKNLSSISKRHVKVYVTQRNFTFVYAFLHTYISTDIAGLGIAVEAGKVFGERSLLVVVLRS